MHYAVEALWLKGSNVIVTKETTVNHIEKNQFQPVKVFITEAEIEELYERVQQAKVKQGR